MSEPFRKPLNAAEIEALLRTRSDVVSNEPLGPGDVQHLRNTDLPQDLVPSAGWPYDSVSTEELLHQVEHHLVSAMSSESVAPATPQPAAFAPLAASTDASTSGGLPLSLIGDVELDVTLELGRASLMIEELLALREGSVVTLDKEAGEPIDILANGKLIARGEVIVVDDKYCIRICEVIA